MPEAKALNSDLALMNVILDRSFAQRNGIANANNIAFVNFDIEISARTAFSQELLDTNNRHHTAMVFEAMGDEACECETTKVVLDYNNANTDGFKQYLDDITANLRTPSIHFKDDETEIIN